MSQMTLVFSVTVCKCSQWNTNLALTQTQWALCDSFLMWCVSQASGPCHYSPSRGVEEKNNSFYRHNGYLMVISWTNAALVYLCVILLCVIGIIHICLSANCIQMGLISERSAGDSQVTSDMRSIKSAWHDPQLSFFSHVLKAKFIQAVLGRSVQ